MAISFFGAPMFMLFDRRMGLPSQWSQPGMPLSAMTGWTMDMNSESPGGSLRR